MSCRYSAASSALDISTVACLSIVGKALATAIEAGCRAASFTPILHKLAAELFGISLAIEIPTKEAMQLASR
jgi:hypothetical protein